MINWWNFDFIWWIRLSFPTNTLFKQQTSLVFNHQTYLTDDFVFTSSPHSCLQFFFVFLLLFQADVSIWGWGCLCVVLFLVTFGPFAIFYFVFYILCFVGGWVWSSYLFERVILIPCNRLIINVIFCISSIICALHWSL